MRSVSPVLHLVVPLVLLLPVGVTEGVVALSGCVIALMERLICLGVEVEGGGFVVGVDLVVSRAQGLEIYGFVCGSRDEL